MVSQRQRTTSTSTSTGDEEAQSNNDGGSGAWTPTSSHEQGPSSPNVSSDIPLPSIERGVDDLGIDLANVTISSPPQHDGTTPSINRRFEELHLGSRACATSNRRASLSPSPQNGCPSPARSIRRSSSRNPVQRHKVDDEEPPTSRFYRRDLQDALTQSKTLARQLADALSSSNLHQDGSSAIYELHSQARDASHYSGPRDWKIGLVGDSGAGKSSLINSLLDTEDLARTSNSGAACTCTVTEYHYHDSSEYKIEVTYFTKDRLLQQFKELLQAYRQFHLHPAEDAHEKRDLEEAASAALYTFKAAFKNQALIMESEGTYLLQQDEQVVLDQLPFWIEESAPPGYSQVGGGTPNVRHESVENVGACSDLLLNLTSEPPEPNAASSWPYIENVKVFLQAKILSRGLVLVDLPGLRDTNSARKMITERYIVNCNEVFAIANIGRATTDAGVKAVIDLARSTKRKYVGIVCTKSEDINSDEARRDWTGPALTSLQNLRRNVAQCKGRLQLIADSLQDDLHEDEELELHRDRRTVENELKTHEYQLQRHMITTRNKRVIAELRRIYEPTVQTVFCISNRLYWRHRNDERDIALPWLRLSEIISLRRHCLGLVAEYQLQDASTFMTDIIPSLISSISLWVQSGSERISSETRAQVREASTEVERILQSELGSVSSESNKISSALISRFNDRVRSMFTIENDQAWRIIAVNATQDWNSSYGAFCRKYGEHTTGVIGYRCWNAEIIEGMVEDVAGPWQQLQNLLRNYTQRRSGVVETSFERALNPLQAINLMVNDRDNFDSVQTLITSLLQRKTLLCIETLDLATEFDRAIAQLGNVDFLSGIRTSFIGQHMENAYNTARQDYGDKVTRRRRGVINAKVSDLDIFNTMQRKLETQFQVLSQDLEEKVHTANKKHLRAIRSALDTLRCENAVLEAEQNPEFRERMRKEVVDAEPRLRYIAAAVRAARS